MLILVTYDVNTETVEGKKRLRKVAKICVNYGQRVQNSVFECILDAAQYVVFKATLLKLIDTEVDSLRFYQLGNNYKSRESGIHYLSGVCPKKNAAFTKRRLPYFNDANHECHPAGSSDCQLSGL